LALYSYVWLVGNFIALNMVGMVELLYTTPAFWLSILLVPIIALVPDIMTTALKTTVWPTKTDKVNNQVHSLQ
jgi:hypothetical protein